MQICMYMTAQSVLCRDNEALQAFAQDAYQCSLAYGPEDVRTSLGYYNLAKVFQGMGELDRTIACCDQAGLHLLIASVKAACFL